MSDACAWCGAPLEAGTPLHGRVGCRVCGAATTHPWPTDAELDEAYGGWYRPRAGRFGRVGDALLRRSRGSLAARIDELAPPGRIVDVGAGDGSLVRALRTRGREAIGLERDASGPDFLLDVDVEHLDGRAAAVVFWHSLEHLRAPRVAIRAAARVAVPGAALFVAVPNAASLQAQVFGDDWLALDLPRHLVHMPARTLIDGLEADGWRVRRVSHWRGGQVVFGWLHGLVGRLPGELDLYQSIRSAGARSQPVDARRRATALAAAIVLLPLAVAASMLEVALRRGGSVYVEATRG